ncbi:MAG: RNA-binding protein [Tissierellia bacterium]|nr:RNA-binding protein [Tissierellia bacterium]
MSILKSNEEYVIKRLDKKNAYLQTKLGEARISKKFIKPKRQGDKVKAFCYYSKNNVLKATVKNLNVDQIYSLELVDINKYGAFFDIGLEFDLLVPKEEMTYKVFKEMTYPIVLKLSKDNKLYGSMKIRNYLSTDHNYKENDEVTGRIYSINKSIGAFVAVDNKYDSLLRIKELKGAHTEGEKLQARVKSVKEDGKIELSLRQRSYLEIDDDSKLIYQILKEHGGKMSIGDKSDPVKIFNNFRLSKSQFKKACGRLYKKGKIKIGNYNIEINER